MMGCSFTEVLDKYLFFEIRNLIIGRASITNTNHWLTIVYFDSFAIYKKYLLSALGYNWTFVPTCKSETPAACCYFTNS